MKVEEHMRKAETNRKQAIELGLAGRNPDTAIAYATMHYVAALAKMEYYRGLPPEEQGE